MHNICNEKFTIQKDSIKWPNWIHYTDIRTFMDEARCDTCSYVCKILQSFTDIKKYNALQSELRHQEKMRLRDNQKIVWKR